MEKDNFIKCRDGKEREIFPALIKYKNKIRHYITRFRTDMAILNIISPDVQKVVESTPTSDNDKEYFSDEPYEAMMELLVLAFGEKYTREEIEGFVDVAMIPKIFDVFFATSGYGEAKKILAKLLEEEKDNMYWEMNGSDKSSYYEVRKQGEQFLR